MDLRHCYIIGKKELKGLYSEKTIVFAIFLQIFLAMFSSFLIVGLASMYDPDAIAGYSAISYPVGYTGADSPLKNILEETQDFKVYTMDLSTAVAALKERKLSAVIHVPDTPPDGEEPIRITLYSIQNDIRTTIVNVKLKDAFLKYEEQLRTIRSDRIDARPLDIVVPPSAGGENFFEFVYGLLIPLLLFMPAIISSALVIDQITEEFQYNTFETLMSTPVTFTETIWGKVAACFFIVPVQSAAWILLLSLNGIPIQGIPEILLHVSVCSFALILLGALTALYYRERTGAQFIFSTAIVAMIVFVLALPMNPLNLIVRLSVGAIGMEHWTILGIFSCATLILAYLTSRYAGYAGKNLLVVK